MAGFVAALWWRLAGASVRFESFTLPISSSGKGSVPMYLMPTSPSKSLSNKPFDLALSLDFADFLAFAGVGFEATAGVAWGGVSAVVAGFTVVFAAVAPTCWAFCAVELTLTVNKKENTRQTNKGFINVV